MATSPQHVFHPNDSDSIDKVLQKEKKAMAVPRPDGDSSSQPEDGPLFRATIASLEKRTGNLKMKIKKLLKRALLVHERQKALVEAERLFLQSLKDTGDTEVPGFQSIIHSYFDNGAKSQIESLRMGADDLNMHVIEPLRRLYDLEIKSFDNRKREFDDESSQYYSWLSRYLSMKQEAKGKKKEENDSKYLDKRKAFELCRFDYYSYMQDLHGGRKQQDVTYQLVLYAESEVSRFINTAENIRQNVKPGLDSIIGDVKDANKDWSRQRTEREVRRRQLERSIVSPSTDSPVEPEMITNENYHNSNNNNIVSMDNAIHPTVTPPPHNIIQQTTQQNNSTTTPPQNEQNAATIISNSNQPNLKVITSDSGQFSSSNHTLQTPTVETATQNLSDSQQLLPPTENDSSSNDSRAQRKKEGLLWAMSRPNNVSDPLSNLNKAGWHKFWVVSAAGKLCEYTNWKQGLDLHNEPINLKVALVREARNAERRFCFEVVTPNYKRVYQATNDEDMHSWIRAINEAISQSLGDTDTGNNSNISNSNLSVSPKAQRVFSRSSGGGSAAAAAATTDEENELRHHRKVRGSAGSEEQHEESKGLGEKLTRKISFHKHKVAEEEAPAVSNLGLLEAIRKSPSNQVCADCGGTNKVEWISINLLSLVCIDCSGVHRSLGTHISKIRSLRLDTVSFTPEVVELIKSVNNADINGIWEHNLDQDKRKAERMGYITEKYIEKKFLIPLDRPNAHLREAIGNLNLKSMLVALANRANPNMMIDDESTSTEESLVSYSLRVASDKGMKTFPLTELLLLNSATLPTTIPNNLGQSAKQYLSKKLAKDHPPSPSNEDRTAGGGQGSGGTKNVGSKLQKRLSVSFQGRSVS